MTGTAVDGRVLDRLYEMIVSRKDGDPERSHTAALFAKGPAKIAQKVGEEAVETLIEGLVGDPVKLADESADLLYHLMVLWAVNGVEPPAVWQALEGRKGISGLVEKAGRDDNDR
jgi:phosphoribosyl-ATP pyrophosphohydrolase